MRSIYNRTLLAAALVAVCGTAAATTPSSTVAGTGQSSVYSNGATTVIVVSHADAASNPLLVRNCKTDPTACVP